MEEATMTPAATKSVGTSLKIDFAGADQISVSFDTMPGNQPNSYGNSIAIWQNQNTVPWNQEPLKVQAIDRNTPSGSMGFHGLNITNNSYIIGYMVGPYLDSGQKCGNVVSTAFLPAGENSEQQQDFESSLTLKFIGTTSVAFSFNMPSGVTPESNGAWCGIWRSSVPSYNNPPEAVIPVNINAQSGTLSFNDFNIGLGLTYTIALFASGWNGGTSPRQTTMSCSLKFTNS